MRMVKTIKQSTPNIVMLIKGNFFPIVMSEGLYRNVGNGELSPFSLEKIDNGHDNFASKLAPRIKSLVKILSLD